MAKAQSLSKRHLFPGDRHERGDRTHTRSLDGRRGSDAHGISGTITVSNFEVRLHGDTAVGHWPTDDGAGLAHAALQNMSVRPTRRSPRAAVRSDLVLPESGPTGSRRIRPGARRERVPTCVSTPTASEAMRATEEEEHRQALPTGESRRTGRQTPEMLLAGRAIRRAEGRVRLIPVTESPRSSALRTPESPVPRSTANAHQPE